MKKPLLAIFHLFISISLYSQPTETYKKSLEAIKINPGMITLDVKTNKNFHSFTLNKYFKKNSSNFKTTNIIDILAT